MKTRRLWLLALAAPISLLAHCGGDDDNGATTVDGGNADGSIDESTVRRSLRGSSSQRSARA